MNDIERDIYEVREKLKNKYGEGSVGVLPHVHVQAATLDGLYFSTVLEALKHGRINRVDSGSFAGSHRLEFDTASLTVTSPTTRPLAPIPREGVEVTTTNEAIEKYFQKYLLSGELEDNEHYTYGSWINGVKNKKVPVGDGNQYAFRDPILCEKGIPRGSKINQLEWCINHFVDKGFGTNHCAITIGCAEALGRYDWKYETETEKGSTECMRDILLKIKDDKLNMSVVFRSWDLVAGLPENLGGLVRLMEYTTEYINAIKKDSQPTVEPGVLSAFSDGLHVYDHNLDLAKLWINLE